MKSSIKISAALPEGFEKIIRDLKRLGYKPSEMVSAGIRLLHKKEFPPYILKGKKKDPTEELTDTEICESILGGKVVTENGLKYCQFKYKNTESKVPLAAMRDQLK